MKDSPAYYCKPISQFIKDAESGICFKELIASIPKEEINNRKSEIDSWRNNIKEMANLLTGIGIPHAHIAFELYAPLSEKRIDCALFGKDSSGNENMVIIELKQWSNDKVKWAKDNCNYEVDDSFSNRLTTYISGEHQILVHPCEQCKSYLDRIQSTLSAILSGEINASALAFCYNYSRSEPNLLADKRYTSVIKEVPLYYKEDCETLRNDLRNLFNGAEESNVLAIFKKGYAEPKRFLDKASDLLKSDSFLKEFAANTDQRIAERGIISSVRSILDNNHLKQVFIINGGPGTGKTIVGMRLLCRFLKLNTDKVCQKNGYSFNPLYMIRSVAFRRFLESKLPKDFYERYITSGIQSSNFFRKKGSSNRIVFYDECHRLGEEEFPMAAVNSLIDNFDIIVFLLDEKQCVAGHYSSPKELINQVVNERKDVNLYPEYTLTSQMRCDASNDYIKWVDSLVYGSNILPQNYSIDYDFRICKSAIELKYLIDEKKEAGFSARICAGYCWPWHSILKDPNNGIFYDDLIIDDFHLPWNTHRKIIPPRGYVTKEEWAFKDEGVKQVGCIYTTQGLEFQYIGVIVGPDFYVSDNVLKTDPKKHSFEKPDGHPKDFDEDFIFNQSKESLKDVFIRNIYRVLLTRGMKGCYVYFCDENLRQYVEKRMPVFSNTE